MSAPGACHRLVVGYGSYDHTRDLVTGAVADAGLELSFTEDEPEAIFHRVEHDRAFDVAEFSFAKYVAFRDQGIDDLVALPIFPSRVFRQSSVYVRADADLHEAGDLAGRRVGVPEWVQTAGVWARGWLEDEGVALSSIGWVQGGVDEVGRRETVTFDPPAGVEVARVEDTTLDDLLLEGWLDAVVTARPPRSFAEGRSRRLLADWRRAEVAAFARTGVFPIMHVTVVRNDLVAREPSLAARLVALFDEARRRSVRRMADYTASRAPVPWLAQHVEEAARVFGDDPFAYGVDPNRATVEAFVAYCRRQGVVSSLLSVEELFPASS